MKLDKETIEEIKNIQTTYKLPDLKSILGEFSNKIQKDFANLNYVFDLASLNFTSEMKKALQEASKNTVLDASFSLVNLNYQMSPKITEAIKAISMPSSLNESMKKFFEEIKVSPIESIISLDISEALETLRESYDKQREYIEKYDSAKTTKNPYFELEILSFSFEKESNNYLLKDLNVLINKFNQNKKKYDSNIEMSHELASNLNDIYIYLNSFLVKIVQKIIPNYNIYGKTGGEDSTDIATIFKALKNYIKEEDVTTFKNIQIYFSLYAVVIRNFYSHGWLDLFPLLSLKKETYRNLSLKYHLINEENIATELMVEFFDDQLLLREYVNTLIKQGMSEEDISSSIDDRFMESYVSGGYITQGQNHARSFLRRVSISETVKNFEYTEFPNAILIFNNEKEDFLSLDHVTALNKINDLIKIFNNML